MERLKASFRGKSLLGWIPLFLLGAWNAVDHLSRAQFVIEHVPVVSGWLRSAYHASVSTIATNIGFMWSPVVFQFVLVIIGVAWIIIFSGRQVTKSNADWALAEDWASRAHAFIRAAYGNDEAARFAFAPKDEYRVHSSPVLQVEVLNAKIAALGQRLEFIKLREGFDPAMWKEAD